ncbi:hypothetical protein AB0O63_35500, partial [Streptomyces cyaneofuscatus]|uniref:hypothetical protein n=1 Tax=Streptomyces cyaneofuscatus TaxID=66883 RepID=UPI00343696E1
MDVVIGRPVVVRAPHRVSTEELEQDIKKRFVHPKLKVWLRQMRSAGVVERPWSAPAAVTFGRKGIGVRSRAAPRRDGLGRLSGGGGGLARLAAAGRGRGSGGP